MAAVMGSPPVMVEPGLASGAKVDTITGLVRKRAALQALMIVGHNPEFGDLAGMLAGKGGPLDLAAGQVVCLDLPPESGGDKPVMVYSVSPEDPV
jgi:phosphohistidine phosphatase SixA